MTGNGWKHDAVSPVVVAALLSLTTAGVGLAFSPLSAATAISDATCGSSQLAVAILSGSGAYSAAGNQGAPFVIVNTSKSSCRLIGYPKVVTDPASYKGSNVKIVHGGGQIFMAVAPRRVSIRPGATASFGLDYGDAYDQGDPAAGPCMTKSATVYLPTRSRPYSQPFNVTLSVNFCFAGFGFAVTSIQPGPIPRMH